MPWLYAWFREHVFRDDTDTIAASLWDDAPAAGTLLLEVGCGPGVYARRLAARFPTLHVVGADRSARQVALATGRRDRDDLANCAFQQADVFALPYRDETFDAVAAARLFTVLPDRHRAVAVMHRLLKPGGRCFIAEPRSPFRACVPLRAMHLVAGLVCILSGRPRTFREPRLPLVLSQGAFHELVSSLPWGRVRVWNDLWYQYAVCERGPSPYPLPRSGEGRRHDSRR